MKDEAVVKRKKTSKNIFEKTNVFFDFFREIDYLFQGKRSTIFIYGALVIVLFAPIIDFIILPRRLSITSITTYLYLLFFLISVVAWAGKFRDERNKWSFRRFKERFKLSISITIDSFNEIKQKDKNGQVFIIGVWLFIVGFIIKALQNISESFRIPFQRIFGLGISSLKTFENWTYLGFILIVIGLIILFVLHILKKVDLFEVFGNKDVKPHLIQLDLLNNSVVSLNNHEQVANLIQSNPDTTFRLTMNNLLDWKPKYMKSEDDYEMDLLKFLTKRLKVDKLKVENQFVIKSGREIGRVDLSINQSIFIELKRKIKSSELDRASGQILKYQRIIENSNIPLILLIVDTEFESIKSKLTEFIEDYNNKHSQKLLAVVVEPK
jgi:hypothetical protein